MTRAKEQTLGSGEAEQVFSYSASPKYEGSVYSMDYSPVNTIIDSVEGSTSGSDKRTQYVTIYYGNGLSKTLYFFSRYGSSSSSSSYSKKIKLSDEFNADEIRGITKMTFVASTDSDIGSRVNCSISCAAYAFKWE